MENRYFDPSDILGFHNMGGGTTPVISSNDQSNTRDALMGRLNYVLKINIFLLLQFVVMDILRLEGLIHMLYFHL